MKVFFCVIWRHLPSETWMRLWSKCVCLYTPFMWKARSLVRKTLEEYSFSCQIQRPTVKLDSIKQMIDTNTFPMTFRWVLTLLRMMMVFLMKVCESVISVAHSHRQSATENLMKCIILLWCSSGTIIQVSVTAQKSASRTGCSFVQSVTKFAHASMAFKTSQVCYGAVNWTRSDGKSRGWLPVNWWSLAVSIRQVLNWSVRLFTHCW